MSTYYVSPTGNDTTGDGSSGNPWQHIYYAVTQTSDGDTIKCKSGTYNNETSNCNVGSKTLRIESESGNYEDVSVEISSSLTQGEYIYCGSTGAGIELYNITFVISADKQLVNITNSDSDQIDIINNYIKVTYSSYSVRLIDSDYGTTDKHRIYKNTIRNTSGTKGGTGIFVYNYGSADVIIKDNIITGFTYGIDVNKTYGTVVMDYNDVWDNTTNWYRTASQGANSISSDPDFVNSSDATIEATSSCVDEGVVITGYVETYNGTAPDIGCNEVSGYKISGYVKVSGTGVLGAIVRCINQDDDSDVSDTTTNSSGYFEITNLNNTKKYHLTAEYTNGGNKYNFPSLWDIIPVS